MAWTAPRTWVVGEVLTAALMNAQVRDNQLAIASVAGLLLTTAGGLGADVSGVAKGGLLSGLAANSWGIKTVGTDGYFLKADSTAAGGITWVAVPTPITHDVFMWLPGLPDVVLASSAFLKYAFKPTADSQACTAFKMSSVTNHIMAAFTRKGNSFSDPIANTHDAAVTSAESLNDTKSANYCIVTDPGSAVGDYEFMVGADVAGVPDTFRIWARLRGAGENWTLCTIAGANVPINANSAIYLIAQCGTDKLCIWDQDDLCFGNITGAGPGFTVTFTDAKVTAIGLATGAGGYFCAMGFNGTNLLLCNAIANAESAVVDSIWRFKEFSAVGAAVKAVTTRGIAVSGAYEAVVGSSSVPYGQIVGVGSINSEWCVAVFAPPLDPPATNGLGNVGNLVSIDWNDQTAD